MSYTTVGYALVKLSDNSIVLQFSLVPQGTTIKVPHDDGGFTWELPGWTDGAYSIVPVVESDVVKTSLQIATKQPPYFDGTNVVVESIVTDIPAEDANKAIDFMASVVITKQYPDWKQRNITARSIELLQKQFLDTLTADDSLEIASYHSVWDWIKAVRIRSNELQQAYQQGSAIDVTAGTIDGVGGWPE